jgi:hypothetical protein
LVLDGIAGIKFLTEMRPVHTWAIIRAHFSFYFMCPTMIAKRKKISYKRKNYHHSKSIIWQYYVLGRKTFTKILGEYI